MSGEWRALETGLLGVMRGGGGGGCVTCCSATGKKHSRAGRRGRERGRRVSRLPLGQLGRAAGLNGDGDSIAVGRTVVIGSTGGGADHLVGHPDHLLRALGLSGVGVGVVSVIVVQG